MGLHSVALVHSYKIPASVVAACVGGCPHKDAFCFPKCMFLKAAGSSSMCLCWLCCLHSELGKTVLVLLDFILIFRWIRLLPNVPEEWTNTGCQSICFFFFSVPSQQSPYHSAFFLLWLYTQKAQQTPGSNLLFFWRSDLKHKLGF